MKTARRIEMGVASTVGTVGCTVHVDGTEVDSWSAREATARAGYQVWALTPEQVASLRADVAASFTRSDDPMARF